MTVEWTWPAKKRLREIFDYHKEVAGERTVRKIVDGIIGHPRILANNPRSGEREQLLQDQPEEYRRLVEGKYKIIYVVGHDKISIINIFDCRRDPAALRESVIGEK